MLISLTSQLFEHYIVAIYDDSFNMPFPRYDFFSPEVMIVIRVGMKSVLMDEMEAWHRNED